MPEIGSLYVSLGLDSAQFDRQITQVPAKLQVVEKGTKQLSFAVQNLSFQLNDIATSLASGGSPFRVLAQQSGQIVQIFQQSGGVRPVLAGLATSIRGLITPVTAAAAGFTALAAGVGLLVARAVEGQTAVRQFDVLLKGLGTGGQATATGLEAAAKRLRDVGLSASEAREAMIAAQRAGIAPGQSERVVRIGQNLTPVLGENAQQTFVQAIAGGVETLGKLGVQLGVVTERELAAARAAAQFGQEMQFLDQWVGRIEGRVKGLNNEALSPVGRSLRELKQSIAELLDAMANSKAIQTLVDGLNAVAKTLTSIFSLRAPDWWNNLFGKGGQFLGPPVATAPIPSASSSSGGGGSFHDPRGLGGFIRETAAKYGIDPDVAMRVAASEGLATFLGDKGKSGGAFQLYTGGGLGNEFQQQTGLNPLDPVNERTTIDFALKTAARVGWGPWHGAARVGIGRMEGIGGAGSVLARPGGPQDAFLGAREAEFGLMTNETRYQALADRAIAAALDRRGAGAGAETEVRMQATLETGRRFGFNNSALARDQISQRTRQMFDALQARTERSFAERNQQDREHAEILKLEASLQGKSSEEIQRQVDLLRAKQEAERGGLAISSEAVQNRLKEVNALADANAMLARQRELWGQIQEIGGVFENAFSRAFDGIADGTFKLGAAIKSLAQDLIKTFASQAFKQLLHGNAGDSGGGIMGMLFGGGGFGKLFGLGGTDYDAINNAPGMGGGGDIPAFAGGGSFRVGGSGAIDSQLVRFRASPGEMVNISHGNDNGGGYGEPIRIVLQHDAAFVGGIADQRIVTRSGQIVEVAVRQSQQATQRNFGAYTAQARARTL